MHEIIKKLVNEHPNKTIELLEEWVYKMPEEAKEGIENCLIMEKPQKNYEEKCYYHTMAGKNCVSIFNDDIRKGIKIRK